METLRPKVDALLLSLLTSEQLRREKRQLPLDGIVRIGTVGNRAHVADGSRKLRGVGCKILLGFAA
jgi:hypothetical protein